VHQLEIKVLNIIDARCNHEDWKYLESFEICYWMKDGEDQLDLTCE